MKKGQMFIVTMVFLVSLIFVVQQNLFQYSSVDTVNVFKNHDIYILNNMRELFNNTLQLSPDCTNATINLQNLSVYLDNEIFLSGYIVDIGETLNNIDCNNWSTSDPVVRLELRIIRGVETETEAVYFLYR